MNTPNPNPSPELREERSAWLRDRLLYAIQFHMWADATAAEVEEVIESLSDSDEYDPNVAALVQMPKWCSPCEAQQGVDAFFASPQTLPAPGEVEVEVDITLLDDLATHLSSMRIFLTSRELAHEAGVHWHDELVAKVNAVREMHNV